MKVSSYSTTFYLISALFFFTSVVHGIEETFCAGVGYSDPQDSTGGAGLKSMGASVWYAGIVNSFWGANTVSRTYQQPKEDELDMIISGVQVMNSKTGATRFLNGWLEVKIARKQGTRFVAVAVWAMTIERQTFGEFFVSDAACSTNKQWATLDSLLPCSATPIEDAKNPNMFVLTNDKGQGPTEINLLWKADMSVCNFPKEVYFAIAFNSHRWSPLPPPPLDIVDAGSEQNPLGPLFLRSLRLRPRFYGPAGAVSDPDEKIDCQFKPFANQFPGWLDSKNAQVKSSLRSWPPKFYLPRWQKRSDGTVFENVTEGSMTATCKAQPSGVVTFGGRCENYPTVSELKGQRTWGSFGASPKCVVDITKELIVEDRNRLQGMFDDAVEGPRKAQVEKGCDCGVVPAKAELQQVASGRTDILFTDSNPYNVLGQGCEVKTVEEYNKLGLCTNSVAGKEAEGIRLAHAMMHLLSAVVLVPVSCFMTRYLKGRLPRARGKQVPHVPVKEWYQLHIFMTLPVICMYVGASSTISTQRETLGRSRNQFATYHRLAGYFCMALFGFECASGFIRPVNVGVRRVWIALHWLGGVLLYYGTMVTSIMTYQIPGSPFASKRHLDEGFSKMQEHPPATALIVWLGVDLLFHLFTTVYLIKFDLSWLRVRSNLCSYFPVILPQSTEAYKSNVTEEKFHHVDNFIHTLFYVYCVACSVSFVLVLTLMLSSKSGQGLGDMECTHDDQGVFTAGHRHSSNLTSYLIARKHEFCTELGE